MERKYNNTEEMIESMLNMEEEELRFSLQYMSEVYQRRIREKTDVITSLLGLIDEAYHIMSRSKLTIALGGDRHLLEDMTAWLEGYKLSHEGGWDEKKN